jgi:hypothetical protein
MEVLNAMQMKAGAKSDKNRLGTLIQPVQFLPRDKKDEQWCAWNVDWLEFQGLKQLRSNARRLMKNYKLAKGIIDKTDYIVEEDNEYGELMDTLTKEDNSALELKFYPIIPNVINTLVSEFAKRSTRVSFRAMDEYSYNEMLAQKNEQVSQALLFDAEQRVLVKLQEMGLDPNSPEAQQQLAPESLKSLPEIQSFFSKDYRSMEEQWAERQHAVDIERFGMEELEERAFRDSLITDREFWHYRMLEDDYVVELWNPVLTFYHKSPDVRYIADSNWVGKAEMMTASDVVDKYGWMMTEEQLESLEAIYPIRAAGYAVTGYQNDGTFYDATRSHEWNVNMPSLGWRQYASMWDNLGAGGDIVNWVLSESEDYQAMGQAYLLRVTTAYWKTQRRVGHLTKVDDNGNVTQDVVDEIYKVTDRPMYNTTLMKNKTKDNLMFGEHIDWIWINQTYGGIKIGPNRPSFWGMPNSGGITPIYLGINRNTIGPLPFQFKGDDSLYGCKLPVEGAVFSDRNTRSTALVDLMKPFQIGYNIVNNQIADILIDELGTVILLDQNALPRHSMGEDWGKNNLAKAYVAMKNFQMLPLDTSITNTENAMNFQHFTKLDLEQSNRLLSRINLAKYFKEQCFETIGITPQRLGQQLSQTNTATGVEQSVTASYAQTEVYFIQHCDYLMPRVHQMRTNLAQYYQSNKPSVRLQSITTTEDRKNFEINGTKLLLRDLNIFCTTKANTRNIIEQLKGLALGNNTSGASIYDLGHMIKSETLAEVDSVLKDIESKATAQRQEEQQAATRQQQADIEAKAQARKEQMEFESTEKAKDRKAAILEAEIRSAGYGASMDINKNAQSDYLDALGQIQKTDQFQQTMNVQQQKVDHQAKTHDDKMELAREKMQTERDIADNQLKIAQTNKNQFDIKKGVQKKGKK